STASSSLSAASTTNNTARLSDATIYAFLANQPNGSQVVHEDLEQIHEDDLEEIDLKLQLALLSTIGIIINGSDTAGYDKTKVECFNCHKMGHFVRECRNPRSQENRSRNQDSSRRTVNVEESSSKAMLAIDEVGFDWSFMTEEKTPTNFALMAFSDSEVHNNKTCSKTCLKSFKDLKSQYANLRIELNKSEFDLANYKRGLASVEEQLVFYKKNEDCDFHDKMMVQKPVLNNVKKRTCQREVRPVWNNAMRTNHKNFSNTRKNIAPTAVLTKSRLVPISVARQNSSRTATTISAARPIKTAAPKPFVNVAKTRPNAFQKSHSPSRRPFYQQITLKNRNLNNKVNTVKANSVNTAKGKRVTSAVGEQGIDAVKSKACWVWRPKLKVLDHVSKNSRSYMWEDIAVSMNILSVLVVYHTTNGHQFTMSNRLQELASPKQTVLSKANGLGKDFPNPLMAGSLPKTIKQSNDPPLSRGYTLGSGEDSLELMELMANYTQIVCFVRKKNREICTVSVKLTLLGKYYYYWMKLVLLGLALVLLDQT
ncbi:ribonuclease H-like domain-containing protein, partial [Tanacetum coccineum]